MLPCTCDGEAANDEAAAAANGNDSKPRFEESKKSKAMRRKERKAAREAEAERLRREESAAEGPSMREIEIGRIETELVRNGLKIHHVAADGHCLYRSVAHVIREEDAFSLKKFKSHVDSLNLPESDLTRGTFDFKQLRRLCAAFMKNARDDFAPFVTLPSGKTFAAYCDDVANSSSWGGQPELKALSHVLGVPITIYAAEGPRVTMGEHFNAAPIMLSFHRHYFALGEHYNAVVRDAKIA